MKTRRMYCMAAAIMLLPWLIASSLAATADMSITNTTLPNPATVSTTTVPRNLIYGMNVTNKGPDPATGVQVAFVLPQQVTLVSATLAFINASPKPCTSTTTTVTCNIGSMGVGQLAGAAVFVVVRPQTTGMLTATATVTADQPDPDTSNNSVTRETVVMPQVPNPVVTDPRLMVSTVVSGLTTPTSMAFLGDHDFLVLEQLSGKVKRVVNGTVQSTVLDLGVNNFSERGLLGITLHPNFAVNQRSFVYLYWTCRSSVRLGECDGLTSSQDTNPVLADSDKIPLLGNRVDRFVWSGDLPNPTLTFDKNLIQLRAFQEDATNGVPRGNHNGGKIAFGPDRKLYIYIGDNGRRGWMQNITTAFGPQSCVPFKPAGVPCDDQFGGPEPDNAHLTGVILRLNDDGTTPEGNPFFDIEASDLPPDLQSAATPEVLANLQKVFAYGIRNGFGFAFDRITGKLWESQNADDAGSEINIFEAGSNGGWVQIMGRLDHIFDFKDIETSPKYFGLQQVRWPPTLIADSPEQALDRLLMLPDADYTDPVLTWKFEVAPAGFGFVEGQGLGPEFDGDLVVGGARDFLLQGHLFRFKLTDDREDIDLSFDPELDETRFIQDLDKWDITGSENFLFGKGFGVTTDIKTGPNGNLFVVSLSKGAVYEIRRRP